MLTSLWTCSRHVCFVNFGVAWAIYIYIFIHKKSQWKSHIYKYVNINLCIHLHLASLLYTCKCSYLLVYMFAHNIRTHIHIFIFIYIYISHVCVFIFTCILMFGQLKLTCGGSSTALSQTISQSLQRSLIMAQEQKSTRRNEQKAPKNTSCPRAARPISLITG